LLTAAQLVFVVCAVVVVVSVALVVAGVAVLAGVGWALVSAGGLLGVSAIGGAVVLLRDSEIRAL